MIGPTELLLLIAAVAWLALPVLAFAAFMVWLWRRGPRGTWPVCSRTFVGDANYCSNCGKDIRTVYLCALHLLY